MLNKKPASFKVFNKTYKIYEKAAAKMKRMYQAAKARLHFID